MKLSEVDEPKSYRVKQVNGNESLRLMEMGILPGTTLQLVRKAPLGFPIEIKVRGYLLSLRESEASSIEID